MTPSWPVQHRRLLPFAPMIYVAWADGVLTRDEFASIRDRIAAEEWLDEECRAALDAWLDRESPPAPGALRDLLAMLRQEADALPAAERASLAGLGERLARSAGLESELDPSAVSSALRHLEAALGAPGREALRDLIGSRVPGAAPRTAPEPPPFDPAALHRYLDGDHAELRGRVLELLSGPGFALDVGLSPTQQREQVWARLKRLAEEGLGGVGYPAEYGGGGNLGGAIAVFETLAYHDQSLVVKYGVNFGLFGGSVLQLGTRSHHERYLREIAEARLPGCFAMTEIGHGSNVRDLETVATYDPDAQEFVVDSPTASATKDWIGNAAMHARMATVFAQLETGGERHGVHAFLVPLRDEDGGVLPGVTITDCGLKEGLNGVDNGRIHFDHVRIPRENLLNRFGDVAPDGAYSSAIASESRRFFTMLGTLVTGRMSIAAASLSASKVGLATALRYSARRRQFGPAGEAEVPVLDFPTQQRLLFPHLAAAYGLDFTLEDVVRRYARHQASGGGEAGDQEAREIETLAAGLKAYASRHAIRTLQAAREACGGQGYLAANRIPQLRADTDVFATFEGANVVLWQLVAKELLAGYAAQFGDMKLWDVARYLADRAAGRVSELNPIVKRRTEPDHLRDVDFQIGALRYREERMLGAAARRLKRRMDEGMDSFDAMNQTQDHLVSLGRAHIERYVLERFAVGVEACTDASLREPLDVLRALFGMRALERERAWFLEAGYFETAKARAVRAQVNALCAQLRPLAVPLVDAFGIPAALLPEIAT